MQAIHYDYKQNIADVFHIEHGITALVGGGGKTTLMYALADALSDRGRVIVTTSTHIFPPTHLPIISDPCKESVCKAFETSPVVCIGIPDVNGKLVSSHLGATELLLFCDYVLVEADGAKRLPLKAPAVHEPVIPVGTSHVVAVAGLDGIGKTIQETVFRAECYASLIQKNMRDIVGPEDIARVLQHSLGQRKGVTSQMHFSVLLNKADTSSLRMLGDLIAEQLDPSLVDMAVIASFKNLYQHT